MSTRERTVFPHGVVRADDSNLPRQVILRPQGEHDYRSGL